MNQEPKSIWKQPLTGKRKWLAWFVVLVSATFVVCLCIRLGAEMDASAWRSVWVALIIGVASSVLLLLLIPFLHWFCCWRIFRRLLFGVACLVTLIFLAYAVENWRGKRAWEAHKRQWEAKGEKFTLTQLAPPPVPADQNFAMTPLLKPVLDYTHGPKGIVWHDTNGLARLHKLSADLSDRRKELERDVLGSLEKGTFADLEACRNFYRGNTNYPQPAKPGTPATDILFALGKFYLEIAELREAAVTRPYSRFPIEYDSEMPAAILLPHLATIKELSVLDQLQVVAKLEAGASQEAFADLKLGYRLSDSIRDEPLLIDHLVRIATLVMNLQSVREGLLRHAWSDAQLAELEKHLASLNLLAEYKLAIRGERACSTGSLDWLRRQKFMSSWSGRLFGGSLLEARLMSLMPRGWFYQNMLTMSEMFQEFNIPTVDEKTHRVFPRIADESDAAVGKLLQRSGPYNLFARMLMPALSRAAVKSAKTQTFVDAARVACALERYRLANGKLPETLDALTPRYIEAIPTDVIDGKPLRYHLKPDGGYVIYSVGWNQTDDGGTIGLTPNGKAVDIDKGDWVWPMPGK